MQDIRVITLDLDDTLWAIGPVIARAEARLFEWFGQHYPRIVEEHSIETARRLRSEVLNEFPERAHDLTFQRRTVITRLAEQAGYPDIAVDEAFAVFDEVRNDLELFPEVRPALESLRRRFRLVAVTNGNADLEKIGIDHLFHDFVSARTAGASKPDRRIFDAAVAAGEAAPTATLHVGDHPDMDVHGARLAGLRAVWMNRDAAPWPGHLEAPQHVIRDLAELERLLSPEN